MESTSMTKHEPRALAQEETKTNEWTLKPRIDIVDKGETVLLFADMPGISESSLEITVEEDLLRVVGRVEETPDDSLQLSYREYRSGTFEREFRLSADIDRDGIGAVVKDGVLKLTLPKKEATKARKIEVKLG